MLPIYPTTELEAVNDILSVLGEAPVSTLEDNGRVDTATAVTTLRSISRAVQADGWTWNTERAYTLTPTFPEGYLYLPANTLRVDSVAEDRRKRVIQRGLRLWDRDDHTFAFDSSLQVDLVLGLAFDELPEPARRYITIRTGRVYQARHLGSDMISSFAERDEREALEALRHEETENGDFNMRRSDPVARIMER